MPSLQEFYSKKDLQKDSPRSLTSAEKHEGLHASWRAGSPWELGDDLWDGSVDWLLVNTHSKGVLANAAGPRGILEVTMPFSFETAEKMCIFWWVSSTAVLPISLVTCGWSNSFIHAASRRNSSMSVEVKMSAGRKGHCKFSSLVLQWMAPKDITDNDLQKLVLCGGFAHPPRPTARWASLQQGRAWHFHLGQWSVSMHQGQLVNCFLAEERADN